MSGSHVLLELVVVLGSAALVTVLFQAMHLPVVLGYVLAGLLIGPHVPVPLVANIQLVTVLSELGVILLMFTVGTELRLSTIARVGLPAALTAVFEVALAIMAGTLVASALGWAPVEALFAGACLGISSTMLVAKAFEDHKWKGGFTEVVFGILVFEDLIAIVLLAVLAGVSSGTGLDAPDVVRLIGRLGGFLLLLLVGGLLVIPRIVRWVAERARAETLLIVALAVCFGASVLAHHAGYSVALGAFIAGVLVAESGHGETVFKQVMPFRDVFAMVFFVSVGMSIDPQLLATNFPIILLFSVVVIATKPLGVMLGVFLGGHGFRPAVRAGLTLSQIGELSFVIAGIGVTTGVARPDLLAIAVGVCCVTTVTSGIMITKSDRLSAWFAGRLPERLGRFVSFYESWLGRLRGRDARTPWRGLRRPIFVLIVDTTILIAIVIGAATFSPAIADKLGLAGTPAQIAIASIAAVIATPFVVSLVRRVVVIARMLALEVIPAGAEVDLGRAPRRALMIMFEIGVGLVVAVPVVAVTQPFVPGGWLVVLIVVFGLVIIAHRSLRDFDGHVRAGSELILELLSHPQQQRTEELGHVEAVLPGFGGIASITLAMASPAVGRSLAELDLRAKTGATVLAISRDKGGMASPSPIEPLKTGDVLAMAGSDEAIAAARELLSPPLPLGAQIVLLPDSSSP
jgi:CPA2 family monovalent cation:H+ antiporter-2